MELLESARDVIKYVKDHSRILVGGFLGVGAPELFIDALLESNVAHLELVATDTAFPDKGVGRLISDRRVAKLVTSHIGTNPETGKQFNAGDLEVQFVPQGTLVECIRAAGAGLGAVVTPTGVGTSVAEGKQTIIIDNKEYLVEMPLHGDVALIRAHKADAFGNLVYYGTARNFSPIMATAADIVLVEADEIVDELDPEIIVTPGIFVDYVIANPKAGRT